MVINIMGNPFWVIFVAQKGAEFNELNNFAKTHNLHLVEDGEENCYTIDDENYKPEKKDITKFLKVLKDSGDWDANSYPGDGISPHFLVISRLSDKGDKNALYN